MSFRNAYPSRNQVTDDGVADANSRRRSSSSSSIFVGSSYLMKGKYISMLFLLINLLGLLQYRGVMNRTLQEITIHNELSYERERESAGIPPSQLLPRHASSSSTNISETILHSQNQELEQLNSTTTSGKFAYAFLLGGAMSPRTSSDYRGGLYSVIVAAHNLRLSGSKADMVLMIQMSSITNFTRLPLLEETLLYKMNIRILYLPRYADPKLESFYALMMEKFRILLLDEYDRVMYLDADVMPKCNLDYIMELSHRGDLLKENVVLAYKSEPASGVFFVLKPNASDYTKIVEIITETERKSLELPYPHWDPVEGWGHVIAAEDPWRATQPINGTNWTWHGASADQGLLYYWTKYYKQSVSIINVHKVEQWGTETNNGDLQLLRTDSRTLAEHGCKSIRGVSGWGNVSPYKEFLHFSGPDKPWHRNRTLLEEDIQKNTTLENFSEQGQWYWLLKDALRKTGLRDQVSLDFINPEQTQPAVGRAPSFDQRASYMRRKAKLGWNQYKNDEVYSIQQPDFATISKKGDGLSSDSSSSSSSSSSSIRISNVTTNITGTQNERITAMSTAPDPTATQSEKQAGAPIILLESFQPRTALKPYLTQLKMIEKDIESSSSSSDAAAALRGAGDRAKVQLQFSSKTDAESADTRRWAYTFLLGGARPKSGGTEWVGGLYSVVAATHHLRKLGSRADVVLMVQITAESPHQKLPELEVEILQKMNIKVVYIPKFANSKMECFYSLMMEKFRILNLTEYSRVMYLDYDVMPTCNLDYLFDLSDPLPGLPSSNTDDTANTTLRLKENIILSYQSEPSSGGLFVLKPNATDFNHIQRIIHEKEVKSLELPYPHFDPNVGWGHIITKPDYWKDVRGRVNVNGNWTWYGVEADQGLLYYWTKYVKRSVSIVTRHDVEQWDEDDWDIDANGTLVLRQKQQHDQDFTPTIEKNALKDYGCPVTHFLPVPYNDFFHMTGRAKPWYQKRAQLEDPDCTDKHQRQCNIQGKWYKLLNEALVSIEMLDRVSWDFLGSRGSSPVGIAPSFEQIAHYVYAKKERNWNQYEYKKEESR